MTPPRNTVFRLPLRGVNAYLVDDGDLTLVDAGTPWDGSRLRRALAARRCDVADLDRVLLTHYDVDHVGGLAALDDELDVPVYVADPDASVLEGVASPPRSVKGLTQRLMDGFVTRPSVPVRRVREDDDVGEFTAYRTPGHTPGHTSYVHGSGVAFLGDVAVSVGGQLRPPPRLLTHDSATNAASVRALADRCPPFDVAAPGHGDPLRSSGYGALCRLADKL